MATSLDDIKNPLFWRAIVAEFVGTLFLVLVGCGSCTGWDPAPSVVQIALAFGLSVATMVWCIGNVSGGHINPAVTMAMLITRKISVARAILYVICQCVGAIAGSALLMGVTPQKLRGPLGMTTVSSDLTEEQAFGVEFLITFVLVFTVFGSCDSKRTDLNGSAPLTIGLSVTMCHLFAVKYTGASMNSARTFGPAVITGIWQGHWVYWCGPILGGVVAGLLYDNIFAANASIKKAKGYLLTSDYDGDHYEEEKEDRIQVSDKTSAV